MNKITVKTNSNKYPIGDLFGIFFEDINHAADGGLYGEMIRNRGFEFCTGDNNTYRPLTAWEIKNNDDAKLSVCIERDKPLSPKNPHYLMLCAEANTKASLVNCGYNKGLNLKENEKYYFSFFAKADSPVTVKVSLTDLDSKVYDTVSFVIENSEWSKYTHVFTQNTSDACGRLSLSIDGTGKAYIDMVSLFPETYKGRENGMRKDIAKMLEELKPAFMRFPGGCLIHDGSLDSNDHDSMYRWKNTTGKLWDRPSRKNNWGYNQSLGLGYYEYFCFCEDIGAKPVPILPAAYNPHSGQGAAYDDLQPWIDDALDLIEYANGDKNTKWGRVRAEAGHPEPFNLEYIGIGNEEVGQEFFDRYDFFHKAIKEKYPDIKIINSAGPFPTGGEYERGWKSAQKNGSDLIDEHYYTSPEWMIANYYRYDNIKSDTKVFLGEYASWGNTWYNALVEAAYMTGFENNADTVSMTCYAPLLCNSEYVNWTPDMIWFDNSRVYGSANYYVQKMFMNNQGDYTLDVEKDGLDGVVKIGSEKISGKIELIADRNESEFYDIEVTDNILGITKKYNGFKSDGKDNKLSLDSITSSDYTVKLKAKKSGGGRGFIIRFGDDENGNYYSWGIGGWANDDLILESFVNGRSSCLMQYKFSVSTGHEYNLELRVKGREITAYVDGEKRIYVYDNQPVIEELYVSACKKDNDVILKCVNLNDFEVTSEIKLDGMDEVLGKITEMSGFELSDENSFDNPMKVSPKEKDFKNLHNSWEYIFPKHSVTVFRVR